VYATCIFCHAALGRNEAIEHFPVGRRLAFDAAKGRLWVVCRDCERWNLTPLEERWEAIEECERLFRDTRLRMSTDNIGLARLKEGTTLVRVGAAQRPEMAAWRYGDQFHRRRRKHIAMVSAAVVAAGGFVVAGPVMGLLGGAGVNLINLPNLILAQRTVARVPVGSGMVKLNRRMLRNVSLRPRPELGFELVIPRGVAGTGILGWKRGVTLEGDAALRAARHLLPRINRAGGTASDVARAVGVLETARGPHELFGHHAFGPAAAPRARFVFPGVLSYRWGRDDLGHISAMPAPVRLALEMSLHEEDERRALEGELAELEDRWREAEEVAAISDDMFLPSGVNEMLRKLKGS
jgi:hypothetical protein